MPNVKMTACPDCDGLKSLKATRCWQCLGHYKRAQALHHYCRSCGAQVTLPGGQCQLCRALAFADRVQQTRLAAQAIRRVTNAATYRPASPAAGRPPTASRDDS